jgi:hypothetical protein
VKAWQAIANEAGQARSVEGHAWLGIGMLRSTSGQGVTSN